MRALIATFIAVFLAISLSHPAAANDRQVECMAKAMYHEARAESVEGIKAVGYVILNRTEDPSQFATTPCGVLYQGNQFSGIRSQKITDWKTFNKILDLAEEVYIDPSSDNTNGAIYFHNGSAHPKWSHTKTRCVKIGHHTFYK